MVRSGLHNRRIAITRPVEDANRLADRLRACGAIPIIAPAIEIEFTDPPELDAALARVGDFTWVVFTSRNGVEAVFRRTPSIAGPRIAAIGPATADALRTHGIVPDFIPSSYVAESIVAEIGDVDGHTMLLPRADIARRALADGLRAKGAAVTEVAAYTTRSAREPLPDLDDLDAVTFTSSSTVRGFLERASVPTSAKVVCIGPITAQTALEAGLTVHRVADEFTEDGLVRALETLFSNLDRTSDE